MWRVTPPGLQPADQPGHNRSQAAMAGAEVAEVEVERWRGEEVEWQRGGEVVAEVLLQSDELKLWQHLGRWEKFLW